MDKIVEGLGKTKIVLNWLSTDEGIGIILTGGEKTHIGAIALSLPRPSLTSSHISCDTWQTPVPGHKDIIIAKELAELLCCALNVPISVTVGIHVDNPDPIEIIEIKNNCIIAGNRLISLFRKNT